MKTERNMHTVGDIATIARVSVRTLHHYDEIGLLSPIQRSEAGYRLYSDDDLVRLQQILLYRNLGFSLDEITKIMVDPSFDRLEALVAQRELVLQRMVRDEALVALLDKSILATEEGITMATDEMFEVFGDFDPSQYDEEVVERWGDTDAYRESSRRAKRYGKADWERMKAEQDAVDVRMIAAYSSGAAPTDPAAMDAAEAARLLIDRWFYPLSREMHARLGDMYIADQRFTKHYETKCAGLAQWWRDAIAANASR